MHSFGSKCIENALHSQTTKCCQIFSSHPITVNHASFWIWWHGGFRNYNNSVFIFGAMSLVLLEPESQNSWVAKVTWVLRDTSSTPCNEHYHFTLNILCFLCCRHVVECMCKCTFCSHYLFTGNNISFPFISYLIHFCFSAIDKICFHPQCLSVLASDAITCIPSHRELKFIKYFIFYKMFSFQNFSKN
jgi:hypothetical protein